MIITLEDLGELDPDLDKHTPAQKELVRRALDIIYGGGVILNDYPLAEKLGVTPVVAHAIKECLGVAGLLIPGNIKTPTMTSRTFETVDEFHERVACPAVIELLRVAALWGPGFDCNPPARTPAAIRQAAYALIDGVIGDYDDNDVDQLYENWIEHYGPLPKISFPPGNVGNKIKLTYGANAEEPAPTHAPDGAIH